MLPWKLAAVLAGAAFSCFLGKSNGAPPIIQNAQRVVGGLIVGPAVLVAMWVQLPFMSAFPLGAFMLWPLPEWLFHDVEACTMAGFITQLIQMNSQHGPRFALYFKCVKLLALCAYPRPRVLSTMKQGTLLLAVHFAGVKPWQMTLLCLPGRYVHRLIVELLSRRALRYQESAKNFAPGAPEPKGRGSHDAQLPSDVRAALLYTQVMEQSGGTRERRSSVDCRYKCQPDGYGFESTLAIQEFYKSQHFLTLVVRARWNPDVTREQLEPTMWDIFRDAEFNMCPPLMSLDMDGYYYNFIRKRLQLLLLV